MKCKEEKCTGKVPGGNGLEAFACQQLQLCRYCYRARFHRPKRRALPVCRMGSARIVTYAERKWIARHQFEGVEIFIWAHDPEFFWEWLDSLSWEEE